MTRLDNHPPSPLPVRPPGGAPERPGRRTPPVSPDAATDRADVDQWRTFDGVICFGGEDWWYHNRGHYDMQIMRELSRRVPVLYVNSIGMRMPRVAEGGMFLRRVQRKLRSLARGLVEVRPNFHVLSGFAAPGRRGMRLSRRLLGPQVRRGAARLGIHHPLVWVACPPGLEALDALRPEAMVYQRTDRYEAFSDVDRTQIEAYDAALKARADVTVFCSRLLFEAEGGGCRQALYVDHGVDYDAFAAAGADPAAPEPPDVAAVPRPRVGFVGGIDVHTFWPELFVDVARRLPDAHFVLVGGCSLPPGWCDLSNVRMFGQKPYDEVPRYMAACDVLIMPWNRSEWIRACNPVKLKEYLAVGRPVVSTSFAELEHYTPHVAVADDAPSFAQAVRLALADPGDAEVRRRRVQRETWSAKADRVLATLAEGDVHPAAPARPSV